MKKPKNFTPVYHNWKIGAQFKIHHEIIVGCLMNLQSITKRSESRIFLETAVDIETRKIKYAPQADYETLFNIKRSVWHLNYLNHCILKFMHMQLFSLF